MNGLIKPELTVVNFDIKSVLEYCRNLEEIAQSYQPDQPVLIRINSYGGSADGLLMLYNKIKALELNVVTYTDSHAMSAGAILLASVAPQGNRFATPNAQIMVHEIQSGTYGDIKDMDDQGRCNKIYNDQLMKILAESIGLKDREDIKKLIRDNAEGNHLFLTAKEAQELNIIDHIAHVEMFPNIQFNISAKVNDEAELEKFQETQEEEPKTKKRKTRKKTKKKNNEII